jgi:hypothetical protein
MTEGLRSTSIVAESWRHIVEVNLIEGIVAVLVGGSMLLFITLAVVALASIVTAMIVGVLGGIDAALDGVVWRVHRGPRTQFRPTWGHGASH